MWSAYELGSEKPAPPTPGLQVVVDETDKKIVEGRQKMLDGDPTGDLTRTVDGDFKRFRYRGVNKRPERIARAKAKGFEEIPSDDPAHFPVQMGTTKKEFGDLVLMREPLDLYQRKLQGLREKDEAATRRHRDEQMDKINQIARDAGAVGPHKDAAFDESKEGE